MASSEVERWGPVSVGTVCADENSTVTVGDDYCTVEIEAEFQNPMSIGTLLTRHIHCALGRCHDEPVCIIWRYPCLN